MPPSPRPKKHPSGRPDTGIRKGFARLDVYVEPALRDGLDRLADRESQRSRRSVSRTDIVREALADYLEKHLSQKD